MISRKMLHCFPRLVRLQSWAKANWRDSVKLASLVVTAGAAYQTLNKTLNEAGNRRRTDVAIHLSSLIKDFAGHRHTEAARILDPQSQPVELDWDEKSHHEARRVVSHFIVNNLTVARPWPWQIKFGS